MVENHLDTVSLVFALIVLPPVVCLYWLWVFLGVAKMYYAIREVIKKKIKYAPWE